jgi:UDPglucose--hexose-1-phosphate uridylyltransferase
VSEIDAELRLDALTGEWVAISGRRQGRPNRPDADCPFCVGGLEAPTSYDAHAFENRWPALLPGPPLDAAGDGDGRPDSSPARGAAEVILYATRHDASLASLGVDAVRGVVDLWAERTAALLERPEIEYVLVFENRGRDAGSTIDHPHGQVYAFPMVPPVPARELAVAAGGGCPVCAESGREAAERTRLVLEAPGWRGWVPFASGWPFGLLLAPVAHHAGLPELPDDDRTGLAAALVDAIGRYDRLFRRPFPYMLWVHQRPGDPAAHLHVHLAPPWRGAETLRYVAAGELGSGTLFNPLLPEVAAAQLRDANGDGPASGRRSEAET